MLPLLLFAACLVVVPLGPGGRAAPSSSHHALTVVPAEEEITNINNNNNNGSTVVVSSSTLRTPAEENRQRETADNGDSSRMRDSFMEYVKINILQQTGRMSGHNAAATTTLLHNHTATIPLYLNTYHQQQFVNHSAPFVTERRRSFYPSCDVPRNVDHHHQDDNLLMHLLFVFNQIEGSIALATLRLHRNIVISDNTPPPSTTLPTSSSSSNNDNSCENSLVDDDDNDDRRLYRITIYYHTQQSSGGGGGGSVTAGQSNRKHKVHRRKISDCRMMNASSKFIDLDMSQAMSGTTWTSGKSLGVFVQVEDQYGVVLNAGTFFIGASCTGATTPRPIPTAYEERFGTAAPPYPKLDICTLESPDLLGKASGSSTSSACKLHHHKHVLRHQKHQQQSAAKNRFYDVQKVR